MLALLLAAALGVGEPAPPVQSLDVLQAPEGAPAEENTPAVVEFWATWCAPCVEQIPHWNALAEQYAGRIRFISITAEDRETAAGFLAKRPMAGWTLLDTESAAHKTYGVKSVPRMFLVDAAGIIRAITTPARLTDRDLEALLAARADPVAGEAPKPQPARAPRLIEPADGAVVSYSIRFRWTSLPDTMGYQLQVADSPEFTDFYVNETVSAPFYATEIAVGEPMWWRVRGLRLDGATGPWSVVRKLQVQPPPLADAVFGITLTQTIVPSEGAVDGLVTLDKPAPASGATVQLAVSDDTKVRVPGRLIFVAGETSAPFTIRAAKVEGEAEVRIYAYSRGETRVATLLAGRARPGVLISLAVHPAVVASGAVAQGIVNLSGPSPGTTRVLLSSSDPERAAVPETLTMRPGMAVANFPVRTGHATSAGRVAITATLEGIVRTAWVDLTGAAGHDALRAPEPLAPADRATIPRRGANNFEWLDVIGAASYTIEVATSIDFGSSTIASRDVPFPRITISDLPARGVLFWRVRGNDVKGAPGAWSDPRMLR